MSRSNGVSEKQASQVTEMIIRNLHSSSSISIVERERLRTIAIEQGLNLSTGIFDKDTAAKIGNIIGCQYILFGAVTQITERYSTEGMPLATKNTKETIATIEARIIDIATRRVVLSVSKSGSVLETLKKFSYSSNAVRAATEAAASRVCDKVREVLANEYPMIISVNKNNVRINRGSTSGVNIGALYRVYQEGEELFDLDGSSLGRKAINLAIVRVIDVHSEFSAAEILSKQASEKREHIKNKNYASTSKSSKSGTAVTVNFIREGDKIEAISFSEAENIKLTSKRAEV